MRQFAMLLSDMVCRSDAPRGGLAVDRSAVRYRRKRKEDTAERELLHVPASERRRYAGTGASDS
jgi:hypothetical protein